MEKIYLVKEVMVLLNFKTASGNFHQMLEDLKLPKRTAMKKDSNNRLRRFRCFNDEDLSAMRLYRTRNLNSPVVDKVVCGKKDGLIKDISEKIVELEKLVRELRK